MPSYALDHYPCHTRPLFIQSQFQESTASRGASSLCVIVITCLRLTRTCHKGLISHIFCFLQTLYARALYDNTAETEDELAFRKGDIIIVLGKNAGSIGWWRCSFHGRQGLAPANRLAPLSPAEAEKLYTKLSAQRDFLSNHSHQNIYQTPNATKPPENSVYEDMNTIYKVPHQANPSPDKPTAQEDPEGTRSPHKVSLSLDQPHLFYYWVMFMFYAIVSSWV